MIDKFINALRAFWSGVEQIFNNLFEFVKNHKTGFSIASLFIVTLALGFSVAYFTTKPENKLNTFTVGDVKIVATEPNWEYGEDGYEGIVPNTTVKKDPKITNTGKNDAYVFLKVSIPMANVKTVSSAEAIVSHTDPIDLFEFTAKSDWILVSDEVKTDTNTHELVYAYKDVLTKSASTSTLFDTVKYINILEGEIPMDTELDLAVEGLAIQTENIKLTGSTTADKLKSAYDTFLAEEEK